MSTAWVGMGANLDDAQKSVLHAIERLKALDGIELEACSSLYRTAPIGYEDQSDFVNAVVRVDTDFDPTALLDELQTIENVMGRVREGHRFGPRSIDLDLLVYDDRMCRTERLELPHPRLHERRFVLEPLAEIDPDLDVPGRGRVRQLLNACPPQRVHRIE